MNNNYEILTAVINSFRPCQDVIPTGKPTQRSQRTPEQVAELKRLAKAKRARKAAMRAHWKGVE